jgi:outer membrane protein TolC
MRTRIFPGLLAVSSLAYLGCTTLGKQGQPAVILSQSSGSQSAPRLEDYASPPTRETAFTDESGVGPTIAFVEPGSFPPVIPPSPAVAAMVAPAVEIAPNNCLTMAPPPSGDAGVRGAVAAYPSTGDQVSVTAASAIRLEESGVLDMPSVVDDPTASVNAWPLDLATALELTSGQNPQVAYARERIRESFAKREAARALWLPSLRVGANYHKHEGRIQDVAGTIIETSRNSTYNGFGAQAVGAGSPTIPGVLMNFHLRDSLFQPRIAGQVIGATRQASLAVDNNLLLETALAYSDLLEATQLHAIAATTYENAEKLAQLTQQFADAGAGLPSDADRSATELALRRIELQQASEQFRLRRIRLARLLSQDPNLDIIPTEPFLAPVELIDDSEEAPALVAQGLANRPETLEHRYLVGEAVERLRRERYAPLVPSVLLGLSYGGNGGGLGSQFENYGDRMDFDAVAYWELRNLGVGERAARGEAQSRVRQARYRQVEVLDRVASEIVEAHTQVQAKRDQRAVAETAIASAEASYRRNLERIENGQGLPIEALQSINALDQAQRLYATTVAEYNRAQFRLYRALGFPVQDASPLVIHHSPSPHP